MPWYSSRPTLRQAYGTASRRPTGRPCRGCQRAKDRDAGPGLCWACLDQRDSDKRAHLEGLA